MQNKGFTLVELAIVLVIIGLLVGGVLQGQELIKQAQIRNTVQKFTEYDTALNTFRAKYSAMPGDITRANTFAIDRPKGQGTAAINVADTPDTENDGDGDGSLEDSTDGTYAAFDGEIANFWVHLSNTGLVKGEYANAATAVLTVNDAFPEAPVGVGVIALSEGTTLHWVNGVASTLTDLDATKGGASAAGDTLLPEEAFGIDSKIDDGQPDNGIVRVFEDYNTTTGGEFTDDTNDSATDCISGGEYNLGITTQDCSIYVRASG